MKKQTARKLFIERRNQLSQAAYDNLNYHLLQQFKTLDLTSVHCIHLFLPIHERKEPDTFLIREWLKENHSHIKRVFPKADFAGYTMQNYLDNADLQLATNAFGIPEPVAGNVIEIAEVDLMLIPLLAFDLRGYRAGYGKGFYDRFMAQCKPQTQFIGLSLFEPVDALDDVDEYDIKMHRCVTPHQVFKFPPAP